MLGRPLLYFATGRDRTGNDPRDLAAHLASWGLGDVLASEVPLIGETKPFDWLIAEVLSRNDVPRILEAVPGLLLRNEFDAADMIRACKRTRTTHRLGWLAEIAEKIASKVPVAKIDPQATARIATIREEAWRKRRGEAATVWDNFGVEPDERGGSLVGGLPPLAEKWRIRYRTPQAQFLERARENLGILP